MTVALAAQAPASFEIKSAQLPLVALRVKSPRLDQVGEELARHYADVPDFFDNDALLIDFSALQAGGSAEVEPTPLEFEALLAALLAQRLKPVAVRGGNTQHLALAQKAGLVVAEDVVVPVAPKPNNTVNTTEKPVPTPAALGDGAPSALVIDKPLRSGQQVYARGRDLVVLAMVNPGAEVIADGHIHVYAPLRGKAIAGARGNTDARIFALAMEPELVSIAGIYRTSEVPWPDEVRGKPTQVRLSSGPDGDKLLLDPIKP
ncbi:septum site-determining protein MinC [Hydrogenophaga sp. OTU3427]|uniref:septum site-determining protein MinC n=1 Tax=Hydrogenophaga sp. OTU3427 TaxID=3043856 RepID=UPI00313CC9E9